MAIDLVDLQSISLLRIMVRFCARLIDRLSA